MPQPFGQSDPVKGEGGGEAPPKPPSAETAPLTMPPKPESQFEHPQDYPDASAPPEKANASDNMEEMPMTDEDDGVVAGAAKALGTANRVAQGGPISGDAWADLNGGITGGAQAQSWGTGWKNTQDQGAHDASIADAMPTAVSLDQMLKDNAGMNLDWNQRPLGPDQK